MTEWVDQVSQAWTTTYRYRAVRFKPADYAFEFACIAGLVLYFSWYLAMRHRAAAQALTWWKRHTPQLKEEFALVGAEASDDGLWNESAYQHVGYAAGRRGLRSLTITFNSSFIADPFRWFAEYLWSVLDPTHLKKDNSILLDFLMLAPVGSPGAKFVTAATTSPYAKNLVNRRWDLKHFVSPIDNKKLAKGLFVFSETGDVVDALMKEPEKSKAGFYERFHESPESKGSLVNDIQNPFGGVFQYLTISDMPGVEPDVTPENVDKPVFLPKEAEWRFLVRLDLNKSLENPEITSDIIDFALNLVDFLHEKKNLLPNAALEKLRKKRAATESAVKAEVRSEIKSDESSRPAPSKKTKAKK